MLGEGRASVFSENIFFGGGRGQGGKHMQYFYMSVFDRDIVFQGNITMFLREEH